MMNCEDVQARFSDFTDGLLSPDEHAAVLTHVRGCADCSGVLTDLERLLAAARQLGPVPPPEHLWLELAGQLRQRDHPTTTPNRSGRTRAMWQWVGLSAALLAITTAIYVLGRSSPTTTTTGAAPVDSMQTVSEELTLAMQHYERAIAGLEAVARHDDGQMDPAVSAAVRRSLGSIDSAIAESRAALVSNPDSAPARDSLFEALRQKVSVLQATVSLINEMRQGDPGGATRAMEGLGRQS